MTQRGKHRAPKRVRGKHRAATPVENGIGIALKRIGVTAFAGCAVITSGAMPAYAAPEDAINTERETSEIPVVQAVQVSNKVKTITVSEDSITDFGDVFYRADITSKPAPEPEPEPKPAPPASTQSVNDASTTSETTVAEPSVQDIWVKPVKNYSLTSRYGYRDGIPAAGTSAGLHNGVDFAAPLKTNIHAVAGGTVVHTGFSNFDTHTGGIVVIHHVTPHGEYLSSYNHMKTSDILVNVGDTVQPDQLIALMGTEGMSTGSHLHFTMRKVTGSNPLSDWEYMEPEAFFSSRGVNF